MIFKKQNLEAYQKTRKLLEHSFNHLPEFSENFDWESIDQVLAKTAKRLQDNYPYFHPMYAGQMLKPPHPVARLAYFLAMGINPNNHALDGGRASSAMEKEAVAELAQMFGWKTHLGHLTSGGTMANLESLWIAGQLHPEKTIVASEQAHYTHQRITNVLKIPFQSIPCNTKGQMDLNALENFLNQNHVGTVVITLGTTGTGSVDPLHKILELQKQIKFRVHVDAAYGGYFKLINDLENNAKKAMDHLTEVDSIVVDPHKHGLQPYGCGCVLFKDPSVGRFYKHDSPYTYFSSDDLHLGEISLECSRPGASAVALWATQKLMPLIPGGAFSNNLSQSRQAALDLYSRLDADDRFLTLFQPEMDIVVWAIQGGKISEISDKAQQFFQKAEKKNLYLATFKYPVSHLPETWKNIEKDDAHVTCLRSCLMKPEHLDWLDQIWEKIDITTNIILKTK